MGISCPIWTTNTAASASTSTVVSIPDPMALSTSNISKSQTVIHHYMFNGCSDREYVCTSPHDSVMPSQQRFMPVESVCGGCSCGACVSVCDRPPVSFDYGIYFPL